MSGENSDNGNMYKMIALGVGAAIGGVIALGTFLNRGNDRREREQQHERGIQSRRSSALSRLTPSRSTPRNRLPEHENVVFEILIVGKSNVGKTSLRERYVSGKFDESHAPSIAVHPKNKEVTIRGKDVKLRLNDAGGRSKSEGGWLKEFYRIAHGIMFVYDVTNLDSLNQLETYLKAAAEEVDENVSKVVVGNKIDEKESRKVSTEDGRKLAAAFGAAFIETSAKNNENVTKAFEDLAQQILTSKNRC